MKQENSIRSVFREGQPFRFFLLSILVTGLSYGLYKGVLDNFLVEVVAMGEMDRGVTEFFRELPGIALIFILAAFYMLSAQTLYNIGALVMLIGMAMHAALPPTKILIILAICVYSIGEHIQIGMKSTLSLQFAKPDRGGAALGFQNSSSQIGTLVGYLVIVGLFSFLPTGGDTYRLVFAAAAVLALISLLLSAKVSGHSETDKNKRRFYFHKKYIKYYMLEMF